MPYVVYFEETGEQRIVQSICRRCSERSWLPFTIREAPIVGPKGVAHQQHDRYEGQTLCGKDATGPKWWWKH